ncbi:MAG: hypothetical protein Ct9H300mP16_08480 [Pseudomonadota bacterium]|nr:MAG: hypothetical protein Ct9H300mP16_08480 [Pseudomonadota bacterium]
MRSLFPLLARACYNLESLYTQGALRNIRDQHYYLMSAFIHGDPEAARTASENTSILLKHVT